MAVAPWVGTLAWNGSDPWGRAHTPTDRNFPLRAELVSDGVSNATLTGGPALDAFLLDDGVTFASLVNEPALASLLSV
jgi:hypothetical protein